jgi:hypothetical protein
MRRKSIRLIGAVISLYFLTSCTSVTAIRKVREGMPKEDVERHLGKTDHVSQINGREVGEYRLWTNPEGYFFVGMLTLGIGYIFYKHFTTVCQVDYEGNLAKAADCPEYNVSNHEAVQAARMDAMGQNYSNRKSFGDYYRPQNSAPAGTGGGSFGESYLNSTPAPQPEPVQTPMPRKCSGLRPIAMSGCNSVCIDGKWSMVCRGM